MELKMVKVGKYYFNLSNLSVAEVNENKTEPRKRWIDLTFVGSDAKLRLVEDAGPIIQFLESNSLDL